MSMSSATKMSRTSVSALPSQVPRRIELLAIGPSRPVHALRRAHRLVVRDVDPLVLREVRVQRDVHQSGHRAERRDCRRAGDWIRIELAVADDTKASLFFGDENRTVWQKCDAPRMNEALRDDDRAKAALLVAVERKRTVAKRRAVPRAHARTRGNGASLIAHRRIRIALLLGQRDRCRRRRQQYRQTLRTRRLSSCVSRFAVNYSPTRSAN